MIADWRLFVTFAPLLRTGKVLAYNGAKSSVATAFNRTFVELKLDVGKQPIDEETIF